METRIGKIERINFGHGGYQDAGIGISVTLSGKGWGVSDFKGAWATKRSDYCKWTEEDRLLDLGKAAMWLNEMLNAAKVSSIDQLKGKPVEVTLDGTTLKSWRLLDEAL